LLFIFEFNHLNQSLNFITRFKNMKRLFIFINCIIILTIGFSHFAFASDDRKTLEIGASAPDFSLPGVDGKTYTLASFKNAKVLAIVFMCNHCPTSQAYEERVIKLTSDYAAKGVSVVAINPNNPASLRLDELGYSDVGDSFEEMKIRAKDVHFNFPYLYDGATEIASNKYGPVSTPHIFIFDKDRKLRYQGRIDDMENPHKTPHSLDARNAIDALLSGKEVAVPVTKVFGCSIKWAEKSVWLEKAQVEWAKEPVKLDTIDARGIADLLKNHSDKLRLINVWATWCGPCVEEFADFVTMNRMYRDRGFEFVSISADEPENKDKALKFLQRKQASSPNYIYSGDSKYKLIEAIDPNWKGSLPYTVLVEPDGKVVYAHEGIIDPDQLKLIIFNDPMIGRVYKQ
jgi:peroxiredoxin